jgi:hypothetical protein
MQICASALARPEFWFERRHVFSCDGAVDLSYDCAWINAILVTMNDCGKVSAAML